MAVDTEEELYDVPSEYITGCYERETHPSLNEFSLSDYAKRLIFDSFRKMIGADSRGDMDGERYELEWGSYHITAVHHYEACEKRGGDSYMGFCDTYAEVARDSIEIVEVWDTVYGCNRPTLPGIMNKFYERKKLY